MSESLLFGDYDITLKVVFGSNRGEERIKLHIDGDSEKSSWIKLAR